MNLVLIPIMMSAAICIVCGMALALGAVLLIAPTSRWLGWEIARGAAIALLAGLAFAWAGLLPCAFLWALSERVAIQSLWAAGPVGVLFGVMWHVKRWPIASRRPTQTDAEATGKNTLADRNG